MKINKEKSIGSVIYVVEGASTEVYLLRKIFHKMFDYSFESLAREHSYVKMESTNNPNSRVFVVNTQNSNITSLNDTDFLDKLFAVLHDNYRFDTDNSAIYYLFDRDPESNTDVSSFYRNIELLRNSRENGQFTRGGLLLLSFPSIEAFVLSNFVENSFETKFALGHDLKVYLDHSHINQSHINEDTLIHATAEMENALRRLDAWPIDYDDFFNCGKKVFDYEEELYQSSRKFQALSMLTVSLLDLGLIEIEESV